MTSIRVVCISPYPEAGPSVRHRICGYREYWAAAGIELTIWPFMTERLYKIRRLFGVAATIEKALRVVAAFAVLAWRCTRVNRFDVVIIHREASPLGWTGFERWIARRNRRLVFDFDDAIWQPPSNAVNQRALTWRPNRVAEAISLCAHVVAGNEFLAEYARVVNSRTTIIPTTYAEPAKRASGTQPPRSTPVVVWIGNLGNAFYLRSVLPALEQVAQRIPFQLRLIGGGDILSIKSDTLHIDYREWREEVEIELLAHSDIGIMPLENQAYEKGKCAFKLIQYFSLGLPVVASPVGMNASLIRHGDNGLLAETPAEWVSAISQLLTTPSLRLRCAEGGRLTYEAGYTRERGAAAWIPLIRALASAKRKT